MKKVWIINHYAHTPENGTITRHYYLAKELMDQGLQVKIFTSSAIHNSKDNEITDGSLYAKKNINDRDYVFVKTNNYENNGFSRIKNMVDFYKNVIKTTKHFDKPDVIYASSPHLLTLLAGQKIAKKLKIPIICEVRDLWPESIVEYSRLTKQNLFIKLLYKIEKEIYKKANAVIFTMKGGRDYIIEKGWDKDIDLNKIKYLNNGINLLEFEKNQDVYAYDDEYINSGKFKVVYIGSIRKVNNLLTLILAAQKVKLLGYEDIIFLIYGDGNEKESLEEYCLQNNIDNVVFCGNIPKYYIPSVLKKADANMFHYKISGVHKYGGSQNKLFEYLASKKLIISDMKTNYDIVSENNAGIVTDDQDPETIANAVIKGYNMSTEEKEKYTENAYEAVKNFDMPLLGIQLAKIINNL